MKKLYFSEIVFLLGLLVACQGKKGKSSPPVTSQAENKVEIGDESGDGASGGLEKSTDTEKTGNLNDKNSPGGDSVGTKCLAKSDSLNALLENSSFIDAVALLVSAPDSNESKELAAAVAQNKVICI